MRTPPMLDVRGSEFRCTRITPSRVRAAYQVLDRSNATERV
jgi:hypothetical protein